MDQCLLQSRFRPPVHKLIRETMIEGLDWIVIVISLAISLGIGWWAARKNSGDTESFFLAGRSMPWWLLGVSMVATTFAADTPTLITDWVRT